jgi:hypothetical protein
LNNRSTLDVSAAPRQSIETILMLLLVAPFGQSDTAPTPPMPNNDAERPRGTFVRKGRRIDRRRIAFKGAGSGLHDALHRPYHYYPNLEEANVRRHHSAVSQLHITIGLPSNSLTWDVDQNAGPFASEDHLVNAKETMLAAVR